LALFKILKGVKSNLPSKYTEGYCYFTTDEGKMYIDTTGNASGRVCLNAAKADILATARSFTIGATDKSFNGSSDISWNSNEIGFLDLVKQGTLLADGADINSVGCGNFYSPNSDKSATLINAPITAAGFRLISEKGYSSVADWQFAQTSSRRIFQRFRNSSGWTDWGAIALNNTTADVGSVSLPVYVTKAGNVTACTPSSLFSTLSWSNGTTAGPILNITIAGEEKSATIPSASTTISGIITTGSQRFRGSKTFEYPKISSNNSRY
jgi:hypothetical protein